MTKKISAIIVLLVLFLTLSALLIVSPSLARNEITKSFDIVYENPAGGISSNFLSKEEPVTELGILTDDITVPLTFYSESAVSGTLSYSVSSGGANYVTPMMPANVFLSANTVNTVSVQLMLDTAAITSPVTVSVSVSFSYLKGNVTDTISGVFSFVAAAVDPGGYVPFSSGSVRSYQFIDESLTSYVSDKKLLICISQLDYFSSLSFSAANSAFPANTVYRTTDGTVHILADSGCITVNLENRTDYVLIEFPSAYSGAIRVEGVININQDVYRQTFTPVSYSGTPTLSATPETNPMILNGDNACTITFSERDSFTDTNLTSSASGAANLFFRIEKLTAEGWVTDTDITKLLMPASYGSANVKISDGYVRLSADSAAVEAGTYRIVITQKLWQIKLSEYTFPVFTDYR